MFKLPWKLECLVYTKALTGSFGEMVVVKQSQARWSWILNRAYRSETYGDKMEGGVEGIELVGTGIKTVSCCPVREEWIRGRMTRRSDIQQPPSKLCWQGAPIKQPENRQTYRRHQERPHSRVWAATKCSLITKHAAETSGGGVGKAPLRSPEDLEHKQIQGQ